MLGARMILDPLTVLAGLGYAAVRHSGGQDILRQTLEALTGGVLGNLAFKDLQDLRQRLPGWLDGIHPDRNQDLDRAVTRCALHADFFCLTEALGEPVDLPESRIDRWLQILKERLPEFPASLRPGILTAGTKEQMRRGRKAALDEMNRVEGRDFRRVGIDPNRLLGREDQDVSQSLAREALAGVEAGCGALPEEVRAIFRQKWWGYLCGSFHHEFKINQPAREIYYGMSLAAIGEDVAAIRQDVAEVKRDMAEVRRGISALRAPAAAEPARERLAEPTLFAGRAEELQRTVAVLLAGDASAVAVLWGMGGAGKTLLAQKAVRHDGLAGRFPDGEYLVPLRGTQRNPVAGEDALRGLLMRLGQAPPPGADATELQGIYQSVLSRRRLLILADDAAGEDQVRALLPPPPSALIVTTRRADFLLDGAEVIEVRDWSRTPDVAADMLAQALRGQRILDREQLLAIARACRGLPICLAAAVRLLRSPRYRYVSEVIDALDRAGRGAPDVLATLQLSVDLLARTHPQWERGWRCLGVFNSDFPQSAAASVMGLEPAEAEEVLWACRGRSLLEFTGWDGNEPRFRLHDFYRELALANPGPVEFAARLAHAACFARFLQSCEDEFVNGFRGERSAHAKFSRARADILAGQAWCAAQGVENESIARVLRDYTCNAPWMVGLNLRPNEVISWCRQGLAAAERLKDMRAEGSIRRSLGDACIGIGDGENARREYEQALAIARKTGDRALEAWSHGNLGVVYGHSEQAIRHHEQDLAISREIQDRNGESRAFQNLANTYEARGQYEKAVEYCRQALQMAEEQGNERGESLAHGVLGNVYLDCHDRARALDHNQKRVDILRKMGDPFELCAGLRNLGVVYFQFAEYPLAVEIFQEWSRVAIEIGSQKLTYMAHQYIGNSYFQIGEYELAISSYAEARAVGEKANDKPQIVEAAYLIASAHYKAGRYDEAQAQAEAALQVGDVSTMEFQDGMLSLRLHVLAGDWQDYGELGDFDPRAFLP